MTDTSKNDDEGVDALLAQYADPSRPDPCEECRRRPVPSRWAPGRWVEVHSGSCSQNSAMKACERCGRRHVDLDFGQMLACTMDVSLDEGRDLQRRIVGRLHDPE